MTFVVTQSCIRCKYTDCVEVCPVDCFHETDNMLVIDPEECIDCHLCVPECPVDAIYPDDELPDDQRAFIDINAKLAKENPVITAKAEPYPEADKWASILSKEKYLGKNNEPD